MDSPFSILLSPALPSSALQPVFPKFARDWRCRGPSTARGRTRKLSRWWGLIPFYELTSNDSSDPTGGRLRRHKTSGCFFRLAASTRTGSPGAEMTLQHRRESPTCSYRGLPGAFQYSGGREHLGAGAFMQSSRG